MTVLGMPTHELNTSGGIPIAMMFMIVINHTKYLPYPFKYVFEELLDASFGGYDLWCVNCRSIFLNKTWNSSVLDCENRYARIYTTNPWLALTCVHFEPKDKIYKSNIIYAFTLGSKPVVHYDAFFYCEDVHCSVNNPFVNVNRYASGNGPFYSFSAYNQQGRRKMFFNFSISESSGRIHGSASTYECWSLDQQINRNVYELFF